MIDTLLTNIVRLQRTDFYDAIVLVATGFFVTRLHRLGNVEAGRGFSCLLFVIAEATSRLPIVFFVHPETVKARAQQISFPDSFRLRETQPYLEFNYVVCHAAVVITG